MHLSTNRLLFAALIAVALGWVAIAPAHARQAPDPSCAACFVVSDDGRVLYARAPHARRANASTTKMVTALVAARATEPAEVVTVSGTAAATTGGGLALSPGDRFTVQELLYALLLSSSNDAAVALAEHVAGSEAAFVEAMNAWVAAKGLDDTHFVTSHGLDTPGHYSSASDLARIGRAVLRHPELAAIVATGSTRIGPGVAVENRNLLLETYPGAIGIKTGFTALAGNVLVAAADRHDRRVIAVVMGSQDSFADAAALLDLGFRRLSRGVLLEAGTTVGEIVFDGSGSAAIVVGRTLRGIYDPATISVTFEADVDPGAVAVPGMEVGRVLLRASGRLVATGPAIVLDPPAAGDPSPLVAALGRLLELAFEAARAAGIAP